MSLRKILEELVARARLGEDKEADYFSEKVAIKQILALIPKKMLIDTYVEFGCEPPYDPYAEEKGFNKAIDEITHNLTKEE